MKESTQCLGVGFSLLHANAEFIRLMRPHVEQDAEYFESVLNHYGAPPEMAYLPAGRILSVFQKGPIPGFAEVEPGQQPSESAWNMACSLGSLPLHSRKFLRFVDHK